MTKRPIPSETTLTDNLDKLWKFLGAVSRNKEIRKILRQEGLSKKETQRGWSLLLKANGYREQSTSSEDTPEPVNQVGLALIEINQTDERFFRRTTVVLQGDFPNQLAYLLRGGLSPKDGPESVSSLTTILDRIDVLEDGSDKTRADKKEQDKKAVEKLGKRGINKKERERLRALLALVTAEDSTAEEPAAEEPDPTPEEVAARQEALVDAYYWYKEWAEIAREEITRGDYLITLGLRQRKRRKGDPDDEDIIEDDDEEDEDVA